MHFVSSDDLWHTAQKAYQKERAAILKLLPDADVQHVGSTAVPHSLTKGDLDIQIRVSIDGFKEAVLHLGHRYHENHPELWTLDFALFHEYENSEIPVGIVLTVKDSKFDEFYKVRDLFLASPRLVEQYNAFKMRYEGKREEEYKQAKARLFGPNGSTTLLHNGGHMP